MRNILLNIIWLLFPIICYGQSKRSISLSVAGFETYYHTTNSNTYIGGVLRYGDGFGLSIDVDDTLGKKIGYKIEVVGYSIDNYYKNILPNNQLINVGDDILMINYLFKVLKFNKGFVTTNFNLGMGISTLTSRQYYDEYSNDLGYNDSYLKDDAKFGKNFGFMAIGEAELKLQVMKKISINGGIRFWNSPTGQLTNSRKLTYIAYTGSGFAFTYGFSYKF
jgi:hypothetical protein